MTRSAYEVQRDFALSSGLRSEIIWDSLSPDQADVLRQKIANLICENEAKNTKMVTKQRNELFQNIWQQRKYTNRILLSAIVYVLVTVETDPELALQSTQYSCHPVFRTRKCMRGDTNSDSTSEGCCMVFIDEHGRVYPNWQRYVYGNTLPKGCMIAPNNGIYTFSNDEDLGVELMIQPTPASNIKYRILNVGDKLATVGGLVATVPVAAALAIPVAGPVVIAATAVGVATTAYSTLRSLKRLVDRRCHSQTISLTDREARGNWLGVAGGVVGLGATGATKALTTIASSGREVHTAAQLAVKGINVSSIVISGTGVVHGVYDLYLKISDEELLSGFDVLQIASSLVIFTHSINNLRIASKATNGSSLRRALQNQTRKVINKITQESVKLHGGDSSSSAKKFDIIRTLNDIPYKEALLSLHEINSHLTQGASIVGAIGSTILPSLVTVGGGGKTILNLESLALQFGGKFVQHISNLGSFMDVFDALAKYFSDQVVQLMMQMTRSFVEQNVDTIDRTLNTFVSTETVLYRMLMHCVNTYDDFGFEFLERRRDEILQKIGKYFKSLEAVNVPDCRKYQCKVCKGAYYITKL
ncbi:uncharacterized protein Dwil_GK20460 [Drosophila willistoni]|uniref:GK20460 n=1 Tax=Drosophila willistoni TaxID=7260 RepID=B4N4W6_DROWI|nr:uncharacterized protein LOC6645915 [Drosophila willistoni]EDW79405.1 uncharacterized protein Dwil_GK20460 [Drosophila willistoni]